MLCDRRRNTKKQNALAPVWLHSFITPVSEVSYELRYVQEGSCEEKLDSKFFKNFRKRNDSLENFVRQSLANITRVARITNLKKF